MSYAADISVGGTDGYSSVPIRIEEVLEARSYGRAKLLTRSLDKPQALDKLDALERRVAFNSLKKRTFIRALRRSYRLLGPPWQLRRDGPRPVEHKAVR